MMTRVWLAAFVLLAAVSSAHALTFKHGQKTLNATNGSESLAASANVYGVTLKAASANTVDVMIGGTGLNYSSSKGRTLAPGETLDIAADGGASATFNLQDILLDAGTTAGQIVEYEAVAP